MKVQVSLNCKVSNKVIFAAKMKWLNSEIKYQYSKLSRLEIELYKLHLELTYNLSNYEYEDWCHFYRKVVEVTDHKLNIKNGKLNTKFQKLCSAIPEKPKRNESMKEILVINESSENFSLEELKLLEKGLKYCLPSPKVPMEEIIAGIETSIKDFTVSAKSFVREACKIKIRGICSSTNNLWSIKNGIPLRVSDLKIVVT